MILRKLNKMLIPLLVVAVTAGCIRDEYTPRAAVSEGRIKFSAKIPAQLTPATRSIAGFGESAITTIDLLVFDKDNKLVQHLAVPSINIKAQAGSPNYEVAFTADLADNADARTVVVVANAANVVDVVVNRDTQYSAYGKDKQAILNSLRFFWAGKWKTNPDTDPAADYTPIPMYGEKYLPNGITSDLGNMTIEVWMTRMLARIDVICKDSDFIITNVYLVNSNANGYIAPAWDNDGRILGQLPDAPMIPEPSGKQIGEGNALKYKLNDDYNYGNKGENTELIGEIYTFEALATPGSKDYDRHSESICLIVEGYRYKAPVIEQRSWNSNDYNKSYYYRIDFTEGVDAAGKIPGADGFDPSTVKYMPVYRNHLYEFTITHALSRGYETFDEALKSLGVMNNLKTKLHVVDQSGITNIVYNGQYYLGVGDDVYFESEKDLSATIPVVTNYPDWEVIGSEYYDWFTCEKVGGNIVVTTKTPNTDSGTRWAGLTIQAGRLTTYVCIYQLEQAIYVGRLAGYLDDWNNDGVWSYSDELWIAAAGPELTYADNYWYLNGSSSPSKSLGVESFSGQENTKIIYDEGRKTNPSPYAAVNYCAGKNNIQDTYTIDDFKWFLPSDYELLAAWVSYENFPMELRPQIINTANSSPIYYVSSREYDKDNAWALTFYSGERTVKLKNKHDNMLVRCARMSPISVQEYKLTH